MTYEAYGTSSGYSRIEKTAPEWKFFDLKNDPLEMHNEYNNPDYQKEIKKLKDELVALRKQYEVSEER
jgi:hypothetical protein